MTTTTNVTVYKCDHCLKNYFSKSACIKHESFCTKNIANIPACSGCSNCQNITKEISRESYRYGDGVFESNSFFCTAKNVGMYPLKAVRKGLIEKYPETFEGEIPMPKTCDQYEAIY